MCQGKGNNEATYILGKNRRVGCFRMQTILQTNISAAGPHMWGPRPKVKALFPTLSHTSLFFVLIPYGFYCFFFHKPALAEHIEIPRTKERKEGVLQTEH